MKRNPYLILAGGLNLFTAFLHTIGGQLTLVNPLCKSNLLEQAKAEWIGAWHMVTIVLFLTSFYLLKKGFSKQKGLNLNLEFIQFIAILYILFGIPSIITSIAMNTFAPQWILLMPVGVLALLGIRFQKNQIKN